MSFTDFVTRSPSHSKHMAPKWASVANKFSGIRLNSTNNETSDFKETGTLVWSLNFRDYIIYTRLNVQKLLDDC